MPSIHWNSAIQYAKLVQLAESTPPACDNAHLTSALASVGYKYLQTLYANELAMVMDPHWGDVRSFGFLALSASGELVACIRGTATILDWIHDGACLLVPSPIPGSKGLTEDGFTSIYKSLRIGKEEKSASVREAMGKYLADGGVADVTVCGHSLGAALATLLALDTALHTPCKDPSLYTFASPRVGNPRFAETLDAAVPRSYRIANRQDIVTHLPPMLPLPYEHVNTKYELNSPRGAIRPTIACMHHLTSYIWLMEQLSGVGGNPPGGDCITFGLPPMDQITQSHPQQPRLTEVRSHCRYNEGAETFSASSACARCSSFCL